MAAPFQATTPNGRILKSTNEGWRHIYTVHPDISLGKPKVAISEELNDDIIVRIDPNSREIVGFTIINFVNVFLK